MKDKTIMEKTYFLIEEIIMDKGWKVFLDIVKNGEFGEWLEQNGFSYENELLNEYFQQEDFSDIELIMKICDIFSIDKTYLSSDIMQEIALELNKMRRMLNYVGVQKNADFCPVESQRDLMRALTKDTALIYLCNNDFRIPLEKNMSYIGKGNAVVTVSNKENINFADYGICLKDVTLFLEHDMNVAEDNLNNVTILRNEENSPENLQVFYSLSLGRTFFETKEDFKRRTRDLLKINVGTVFLHEYDYEIDTGKYKISPNWDIRFLDYAVEFSANRKMWFTADAKIAEDIYKNQRKFPIFARFDTDGDKIFITKLTIELQKYGEIEILFKDIETATDDISSGYSGYGVGLIDIAEQYNMIDCDFDESSFWKQMKGIF